MLYNFSTLKASEDADSAVYNCFGGGWLQKIINHLLVSPFDSARF
jgi:hypothetical protein